MNTAHCSNCSQSLTGPFCAQCGLRQPSGRLSMFGLLRDLMARIVDIEAGFVRTLMGVAFRPKTTIQGWLDGRRKHFMHPFALLLICATASVLSIQILGDSFWVEFRNTMAGFSKIADPDDQARFVRFYETAFTLMPYWMLLFCLPIAVSLRLMFPRSGKSVAEFWAVSLYAIALGITLDIPLTLILAWSDITIADQMLATNALLMSTQIFVQGRFMAAGWTGWLRVLLASMLGYPLAGVLQQTIAFTYAYA